MQYGAFYLLIDNFYEKERKNLIKRIKNRAGSIPNAEDVVQESFFRALKYWENFDPNRSMMGWILGIMYTTLADFNRIERNNGMAMVDEEVADVEELVERSIINDELRETLIKMISRKDHPISDILHLHYIRGYTPREIHEVLSIPNKTIRQSLWRFKEEVMNAKKSDGV